MSIQPITHKVRLAVAAAGIGLGLLVLMMAMLSFDSLAAPGRKAAAAPLAPAAPRVPLGKSNIGNYVWRDYNVDGDHLTTPGENEFGAGFNGVLVNLYHDTNQNGVRDPGELISTTVTADNPSTGVVDGGWYNFDITAEGNYYIVEIDASNFLPAGPLEGFVLTSAGVYPVLPDPPPAQWVTTSINDLVVDIMNVDFGFALAGIHVVKTAGNAADGATLYITPNSPVIYTMVVTNPGDTPLANVVVGDDTCAPVVGPQLGGDSNSNNRLDPGETWVYTCSAASVSQDTINTATATGTPTDGTGTPLPDIDDVTDTDPATVEVVNPGIQVVKTANNAADGAIGYIEAGDQVVYHYTVTNAGDTPLGSVVVSDDKCSPLVFTGGDTNSNGRLDLTETWTYTCTTNVSVDTINTATATGTPTDAAGTPLPDIDDVTDTDPATVDVVDPGIQVDKSVDKTIIYAGDTVTYTYEVNNTGDVVLDITSVSDDHCAPLVYTGGDTDSDGLLDLTDTWTYTCSVALSVDTVNIVTGTGQPTDPNGTPLPDVDPVSDDDTETVDVINPRVDIGKVASETVVLPGTSVTYTYTVTNPGDDPLANVVVSDDVCAPVTGPQPGNDTNLNGLLDVGETWYYNCTMVLTQDTANTGTVTANDSLGNPVGPEKDTEFVDVLIAGLQIDKVVDRTLIYAGETVVYTYTVTTTGSDPVLNVNVSDDKCSPVAYVSGDDGDDILQPGETWLYTCTTSLSEDTTNIATVTGEDELGTPLNDQASADVNAIDPQINVDKTATPTVILPGGAVLYTFVVTNPGDDPLSNVVLGDSHCAPLLFVGGDTNLNGKLEPGEGWIYSCTTTVSQDTTNTATVIGDDSFGNPVDDTDQAVVDVVDPGIHVVKTAGSAPDNTILYVPAGSLVTYTYTVTNIGDTPLGSVSVSDDKCSPVVYASGDTIINGLLDQTETWLFTCTATVSVNTTNVAIASGQPANINGDPLPGIGPVQDEDDAVVQMSGSISDLVWWDINGNGVQDPGEPGIPGVTVELTGPVNQSFTTDANGIYTFTNLPPGSYAVSIPPAEFVPGGTLEGWTGSPQNVGSDTTDSDADPNSHVALVILPQGADDTTIDFGFDLASSYVVTKQFSGFEPFAEGEVISFTIRVTNTGLSWITLLPLTDIYTPTYLTYGFQGSYSKPTSDDNVNDGQIDWSDLTTGPPNGNGFDLAPGLGTSIVVTFTAGIDTGTLPFSRTVNVARVSGAFADPDGPQGPLPPDEPLPEQQAVEPVRIIKPTGVTLDAISARARGNRVVLRWQTQSEANILGFNVYRRGGGGLFVGQRADILEPVTAGPSAARASGANRGGSYIVFDEDLLPGVYSYVVEVIRLDGVSWRAAPVVVVAGQG